MQLLLALPKMSNSPTTRSSTAPSMFDNVSTRPSSTASSPPPSESGNQVKEDEIEVGAASPSKVDLN